MASGLDGGVRVGGPLQGEALPDQRSEPSGRPLREREHVVLGSLRAGRRGQRLVEDHIDSAAPS